MIATQEKLSFSSWTIFGPLKFCSFITLLLLFLLNHFIAALIIWNPKKRNTYFLNSVSGYAKIALFLLNIKVSHKSSGRDVRGSLIVANHLSYIDVLVLAVKYPSLFITSVEIKETFFLGQVAKLAGCFFVERRRSKITPGTKERELSQINDMLKKGFSVLLFPEGTSTDGSTILPFKATFFQLAIDANVPVIPLTLMYQGAARDVVPWYGAMTFVDHLLKVSSLKEISIVLHELPAVDGSNKFDLAQKSHAAISECYE